MTPTLTGRSTVLMLLFGLLLPGTYARSGMKAPNGTFMNRLLSTSQTEQFCACAVAEPNTPSPASATVATAPATLLILLPPISCCYTYDTAAPNRSAHRASLLSQLGLYSPGHRASPTRSESSLAV